MFMAFLHKWIFTCTHPYGSSRRQARDCFQLEYWRFFRFPIRQLLRSNLSFWYSLGGWAFFLLVLCCRHLPLRWYFWLWPWILKFLDDTFKLCLYQFKWNVIFSWSNTILGLIKRWIGIRKLYVLGLEELKASQKTAMVIESMLSLIYLENLAYQKFKNKCTISISAPPFTISYKTKVSICEQPESYLA